jgi:hypothetical protein
MEYAQARLQARYGERPSAADWARIRAAGGFSALLESAQGSALRRWSAGLSSTCSLHEAEGALRRRLREFVLEVGAWVPAPWRRAVRWCAVLIDLPALAHLTRGGEIHAWMEADAALAGFAVAEAGRRAVALREARLERIADGATEPLQAWSAQWRALWPDEPVEAREGVEALAGLIRCHLIEFAAAAPEHGWALRARLDQRLGAAFRRYAFAPAAAFALIALVALDVERLRAEIVRRLAPARLP